VTTTKAKTADPAPAEPAPPAPPTVHDHPSLIAALAAFHVDLPRVGKDNTAKVTSDKGSYTYKYADLSEISPVVLPLLGAHGLAWSTCPTIADGMFLLKWELAHTSGETKSGTWPLPDPRSSPQVIGSALTYARRYALCAVTGIAPGDDDDDAQAASQRAQRDAGPRNVDGGGRPQPDRTRAAQAAAAQTDEGQPASKSAEAALELLARTCAQRGWDREKVARYYERETGRALARAAMRDTEEFRKKLLALSEDDTAHLRIADATTPDVPPADEPPADEGE
jgi:hypothetical protein